MLHKIANCCKILFVCFVFVACSNKKEDEKLFEEVNVALTNSNSVIKRRSEDYLRKLEQDLQDPVKKEKAFIWHPKAKQIEKLSNDLIAFINSFQEKIKLNTNSGLQENDAKILFKELLNFQQKILLTDVEINATFKDIVDVVDNKNENEFIHSSNKANEKIRLAIYINKIEIIKEQIIEFCSYHDSMLICGNFETYLPVVIQNSKHFKPDETLEITAGIGTFSKSGQPQIFVNNNIIELQADATATYKTKVSSVAGTYYKTIKIIYTKPDGTRGTVEKEITYTVDE